MGNSCNHEHEEEIEEDTICCTRRRGRYLPKYILGRVSVITVISYLELSEVIQQYQIELLGTEVDSLKSRGRQGGLPYETDGDARRPSGRGSRFL